MKHARKKPEKKISEVKKRTADDYRRKYLLDDSGEETRRKIASAGYKKRSLDSYIPADKLESKVKPSARNTRDDTAKFTAKRVTKEETGKKQTARTALSKKAKSTETKTKQKKSKKISIDWKKLAAPVGVTLFIVLIVLVGVGAGMYSAVYNELEEMNVQNLALNYSSFIYYNDENGNAVEDVQLHYEGERRVWVDSEDISLNLKNAAVAIEDERFYKHNGIDLKRTLGATVGWGLSKIGIGDADYGGSTLTQQLIKNITNEKDKSVTRKVKEMMRAIALERQINDKDEILTMYLNISYFSNMCYGVEAASNLYYAKSAKDLTPAEAALIVGITQRPTYYDPIRNPENALSKRNVVLQKMKEHKYITKEEYEEAVNSPLGLAKSATTSKKIVYSYFVDAVINEVISDLVEQKGYAKDFAEQMVFSGGLKIYTTMSKKVQDAAENVYENRQGFPSNTKPQSAIAIIDPENGEIKGLVGGAGEKTESRGLNRAVQSPRQPGSSIKPISVYAPGIELGKINSATVLRDEKITIGSWSPVNSYSGFKGDLVLSKCIEISANIPAVKALQMLGIDNSFDYAKNKFHLPVVNDDKSLASLGLGGLTNGVTVVDMAGAYAALANGGMYNKPHLYTKVLDPTGKVLLEYTKKPERAVSEATAFIITDMLADVITGASGTGKAAKLNNMPAYGKTGTTNENKDKWFVGYTTHYVAAVWFGFDTPANLKSAGIGNNPSCVIWKNVMNEINKGLEADEFTPPDSVKKATLCSNTGKLASSGCLYAKSGYFVAGNVPTKFCKNIHGGVPLPSVSPSPSGSPELGEGEGTEVSPEPSGDASGGQTGTDTPIATPAPETVATPAPTPTPAPVISLD